MAKERLTVRKIREILRLKEELGLSNRAIARACKVSNSTVGEYLERAQKAGLCWPLPEGLSEDELYQRLFPENAEEASPSTRPLPDLPPKYVPLAMLVPPAEIGKVEVQMFRVQVDDSPGSCGA